MKRKNAMVETPKLKSYSVTVKTPGKNLRIVKRVTPTPSKGRPRRVTKATLLNSGTKSKQKKKHSFDQGGTIFGKSSKF